MKNLPNSSLKKQYDILGAEGPFLSLYIDSKNHDLYLSSFLNGTTGNVFYRTTEELLKQFIRSEVTINELFRKSPDTIVTRIFRNKREKLLKEHFKFPLFEGEYYYNDFNSFCKFEEFEANFG